MTTLRDKLARIFAQEKVEQQEAVAAVQTADAELHALQVAEFRRILLQIKHEVIAAIEYGVKPQGLWLPFNEAYGTSWWRGAAYRDQAGYSVNADYRFEQQLNEFIDYFRHELHIIINFKAKYTREGWSGQRMEEFFDHYMFEVVAEPWTESYPPPRRILSGFVTGNFIYSYSDYSYLKEG